MSRPRWWVGVSQLAPAWLSAPPEPAPPEAVGPPTARDRVVDGLALLLAVAVGLLILVAEVNKNVGGLPTSQLVVDGGCGLLAGLALWWRRRLPLGVALVAVLLGSFSASATPAAMYALFSLAVLRPARSAVLVAVLWIPSGMVYAAYTGRTDTPSVVLLSAAIVLAATAWGMFVRARRQLVLTLRERAERAEADQRLHADRARTAERTRIAREMHDVLAHRISLVALHAGALKVRPDLPPEVVRESAELLRATACQALEELSGVIGVLREEPGKEPAQAAPQPRLSDIPRLVEQSRRAGAKIDLEMQVDRPDAAPSALGRDAYRIVQEALTNIGKHGPGTAGTVRVTGARDGGLHVLVRNRLPVRPPAGPPLPGAGAGLLGLAERIALAGGTLVHGPDGSGDFVVEADLPW